MEKRIEMKLLNEAKIEDLQENMQVIAEMIGLENLYKLSQYANGSELYIPIPESLLRNVRNRKIKEEYNGYNEKNLAIKYSLTEKQIRNILGEYDPKQVTIFEWLGK